ncbi:MAG TPA: serine hydrolase domain-containing protein, partial [Actinoplanes sp.]
MYALIGSSAKRRPTLLTGLAVGLLALALIATSTPTQAAATRDRPSPAALLRLQIAMDAMVADGTPGMYVQIRNGNRITELRSGRPDVDSSRPWTDRSRFRVASVTKTFTAALIMQLVSEGRMRLSDPVERWLPGQAPYGRQITVRQLLNHTSGVPPYEDLQFLLDSFDDFDRQFTPQQLLARIEGRPLLFAPGTASSYSNTGFVLLGLIVERVGGQPLDVALRRRILRPLGLTDTTFEMDRYFPAPRVRGYGSRPGTSDPAVDVTTMNPSWTWGVGNLVSSGRDVLTFLRALMTGQVVPRPQLEAMKVVDPIAYD